MRETPELIRNWPEAVVSGFFCGRPNGSASVLLGSAEPSQCWLSVRLF